MLSVDSIPPPDGDGGATNSCPAVSPSAATAASGTGTVSASGGGFFALIVFFPFLADDTGAMGFPSASIAYASGVSFVASCAFSLLLLLLLPSHDEKNRPKPKPPPLIEFRADACAVVC